MQKTGLGVKRIVMKDGKFLVLVKPNGDPDLPGGRVENGEMQTGCLHREIVEETGLYVGPSDPGSTTGRSERQLAPAAG